MRYYLAGPMTGYPLHNFPAFEAAANLLREAGLQVRTPVEIDQEIGVLEVLRFEDGSIKDVVLLPSYSYEKCMAADLLAIEMCDAIILLPGWNRSKGAKRELAHAIQWGLEVKIYEELIGG